MSDSVEMISCLRHRDNTRYFIYYEDLQEISSEHPDKLAAFIRVLEVKTNKRIVSYASLLEDAIRNGAPIPPLNLWLEVSYNDFVYWSLGTLGRSSFQTADKVAQKKLLVRSRVLMRPIRPDDPDSPKVPYKEYILVRENAQAAIDKQEVPIHGEDYEKYGDTPPVIENIPLLKKTVGMLTETRGGMLEKTGPRVEKNRLINKDKDNTTKESKKSNMSSSDDAPSHQSEKEKYEKRIAELEDKIACFLQASKDGNYPPVPPRGDARPTSAGGNASSQDSASRIHPEHSFIRLDDLDQPTVMIVTLTHAFPHPHSSEMEDKRRERIAAWEVLPTYKKQGLEVEVRWEHETERQTVDAATIVESTVAEGKNHVSTHDIHSDLAYRVHRDNAVQEAQGNGSLMEDVSAPSSNLHNGLSSRSHVNQDVVNTPSDHNAILEPPVRATMPLTQESATIPHSENAPSESPLQPQEMPSSTQAIDESNRQATEQSQQQASGVSPIAGVTIENPPATNNAAPQKPRGGRGKKAVQEPAKLVAVEPDLSHLTEQEQQIYTGLRDEDKPKFLDFTSEVREAYVNWLGSYGFAVPVDITPKFVECLKRLVPLHPSAEILKKKREGIKKLDNQRPPEKRFFKGRSPLIWDVVRDWATIDIAEDAPQPGSSKSSDAPKTYMTRDEAGKLAHDAIVEAKQYNIVITAQVASLENNPDAWIVRVRWDDGSKDGLSFAVRTRGQWGKKLNEIQKMIEEDAKRARFAARMREAK